MLLFRQPCVQFSLQATFPLNIRTRNSPPLSLKTLEIAFPRTQILKFPPPTQMGPLRRPICSNPPFRNPGSTPVSPSSMLTYGKMVLGFFLCRNSQLCIHVEEKREENSTYTTNAKIGLTKKRQPADTKNGGKIIVVRSLHLNVILNLSIIAIIGHKIQYCTNKFTS